ncbi:MAG: response regulator [Geminicoccaceae bacterium]
MEENEGSHIIVVDDDNRLRSLLQRFLTQHGHIVSTAADADEARAKLRNLDFDLMVLDVMMPGETGFELTRDLRRTSSLPIILLTARGGAEDRIRGLESGADDYLAKPFEPRELLLRISTILRRVRPPPAPVDNVEFGDFTFEIENGTLRRGAEIIHLTSGELSLLRALAARPGQPYSRAELADLGRISGSDRAVDVQMARLRRKLEDDPRQPRYLLTMRGEGYALRTGK